MDWSGLLGYIQQGETPTTKFLVKAELPEDLAPLMVAMANTAGGKIFLGVDVRNCHLVGTKQRSEWIQSLVYEACRPAFQFGLDVVVKHDKHIICITIPSGARKPYSFKESSYVMDQGEMRLATPDEIQVMHALHPVTAVAVVEPVVVEEDVVVAEPVPVVAEPKTEKQLFEALPDQNPKLQLNKRQQNALSYLRSKPGRTIRNKEYRQLYKVSHKTSHIELVDLVQRGYILSQGAGRSTCYALVNKA